MAKKDKGDLKASKKNHKEQPARSIPIFERGVQTSQQFAGAFSALMADLASGAMAPQAGNAICNVGGKVLKVVEMQIKYGTNQSDGSKTLLLTGKVEV